MGRPKIGGSLAGSPVGRVGPGNTPGHSGGSGPHHPPRYGHPGRRPAGGHPRAGHRCVYRHHHGRFLPGRHGDPGDEEPPGPGPRGLPGAVHPRGRGAAGSTAGRSEGAVCAAPVGQYTVEGGAHPSHGDDLGAQQDRRHRTGDGPRRPWAAGRARGGDHRPLKGPAMGGSRIHRPAHSADG
ncbi:hypothetical protein DESC_590071 [Desulfosarcina cetonica]|nr:hypothetical protein DESC_590071 [Desulfosarcina cetonica]